MTTFPQNISGDLGQVEWMTQRSVRLGSRTSALAMAQSHHVVALCKQAFPHITIEIVPIKTVGDQRLDKSLGEVAKEVGDKGLFVKELEEALLDSRIDVAIHSMKDMMTVCPSGLAMVPIAEREDPRDVFIAGDGHTKLLELPHGAKVGTSSVRRVNRLAQLRPDIQTIPIRGNVNTRLRKLAEGQVDGLLLAGAGLKRLGLTDNITQWLAPDNEFLPAPAQGILAAEYREDDGDIASLMAAIQHVPTVTQALAERGALAAMESGCHVPFAAYSQLNNERITLTIHHISPDPAYDICLTDSADITDASQLGEALGKRLKAQLRA